MKDQFTIREVLDLAAGMKLPEGWIYLPTKTPDLDTRCLLLDVDIEEDGACNDHGIPIAAVERGFPHEGLDSDDLTSIVEWARQFADPPAAALMLESFLYYWRFDAFLPQPGAPDPPPWEETKMRLDREFYVSLGLERDGVPCREPGCNRGGIELSVLCRAHHFESVKRRPCPFVD